MNLNLSRDNAIELRNKFLSGKYDLIFQVEHEMLTYPGASVPAASGQLWVLPPKHPMAARERIKQSDLKDVPPILHDFQGVCPAPPSCPVALSGAGADGQH